MIASWRTAYPRAKRQDWAHKLGRFGALAAMLLGVGVVPSQAAPITHSYSVDHAVNDYLFGNYVFRLGFDFVLADFGVTISDNLVQFPGPSVSSLPSYKCAEITFSPSPWNPGVNEACVNFQVNLQNSDGVPQAGTHFAAVPGAVNVGISYALFGFPQTGADPVDIGQADNFSSFTLYALNQETFALVHFPENGEPTNISVAHCAGASITACAQANNFLFTVPEPATLLLFGPGMALAFLKRRREGRS